MWSRRRRVIALVGGGLALAVLAMLLASLFWNGDRFKPQIEAAATQALGMDVRIGGRVGLALFPRLRVTIADGAILAATGDTVASAKRTALGLAPLPLLRREVRFSDVEIVAPVVRVERGEDGRLNVEPLRRATTQLALLDGAHVVIRDGSVSYIDRGAGAAPGAGPRFGATKLHAVIEVKPGHYVFDPVTAQLYGGKLRAKLTVDARGALARSDLELTLSEFRIEEFLASLSPEKSPQGAMDFTAKLSGLGATPAQVKESVSGAVSLRGRDLELIGNDLDQALSRFKASQSFHLVDVGAMFLAGPMGLAVSRGYSFSGLLRGADGTTPITMLVSDWKVEKGIAHADDVALATARNRIALKGDLDFVQERFVDVTVAVLDDDGRVRVRQTIRGPFAKPDVDRPNFFQAAAGPVLGLYRNTRRVLPGGEREVFYTGSVPAPKK